MFDTHFRQAIDQPLDRIGRALARRGVSADAVTVAGFAAGLAGVTAIGFGAFALAALLIVVGRVLDGVDGAVARATAKTDRGGFLDITLDFFFYGLVPVAFALADPAANAVMAAVLLSSFFANGSSFLAFAIMAEKRCLETTAQGQKSLYYMRGLVEGGETIAFFLLFCLFPAAFPWLAGLMALLCWISAIGRVVLGYRLLA